MGSSVQRTPPPSSPSSSSLKALAVFACVACVAASRARGAHAATWPLVKERGVNVVEVENRDGGAMTIRANGGTSIRADAIVIEGDMYAEYGDTYDSVSARVYAMESTLATLREALSAADGALANNVTTCLEGKAALLDGLDQLELDITSRRFTPPTCNHVDGARNLIYVYDASAGHNVWQCVCKGDYTGTNCDVPPCDVSAYDLSGTCSGRVTMSSGESCDIDCGDGRVQTEPLKCSEGGVFNEPECKACDECAACIDYSGNTRDYTGYSGDNCDRRQATIATPNCALTAPADGSLGGCGDTLDTGSSCAFSCDDGYYVSQATSCSSEAILTTGRCLRLLWNIQGSTGSVGIDGNEGTFGSAIWDQRGDSSYRGDGVAAGSRLWYYVAYAISVDTDGHYHVGVYANSNRDNDVLLVYESDTFQPSRPEANLKYGNDYAQKGDVTFANATASPWWDGRRYINKPSCFVYLEVAKSYTIVYMPYSSAEVIPDTIEVVCGNPDRDGPGQNYGYGGDIELLADTEYVRGECTMTAGVINDL